ncbi:MAG: 3'-5' exonuclease [Chloroflexia bacterium]
MALKAEYVALDLEMTGQDYERDHIIQIAAIKFNEQREIERWHSLVNPGVAVPLKITRLTGIRPGDLRTAPRFDKVRLELARSSAIGRWSATAWATTCAFSTGPTPASPTPSTTRGS